jgi:hypothetical protein
MRYSVDVSAAVPDTPFLEAHAKFFIAERNRGRHSDLAGVSVPRMSDTPAAPSEAAPSSVPAPSEAAARLAAMVKRSAELAQEMKKTSEKMQALTDQMAREVERAKAQADNAKARANRKQGADRPRLR